MASTLAWSLSRVSPDLPIHIRVRDCLPKVIWPEQATVRFLRSRHTGKDGLQWLNKLEALSDTPMAETIFLDCDMLARRNLDHWWEALATDDLTFWNVRRRPEDIGPEEVVTN